MLVQNGMRAPLRLICALGLAVYGAFAGAQDQTAAVKIRVDAAKTTGTFEPVWSYFGYDECNYTTTPEGRELLADLAKISPAPVYIRTHNLFTSGDGKASLKWGSTNVYTEDAQGKPVYDWKILDQIFDAYKDAKVRPLVELGFMPEDLAAKPEPYRHDWPTTFKTGWASPPKDYDKWEELNYQFVKHMNERYGVDQTKNWIWDVWNEPDGSYWLGTPEDFYKLYDYAAHGVRRALPGALMSGPHVTGGGPADKWMNDFLAHCTTGKNYKTGEIGSPLDFVSFQPKGRPRIDNGKAQMGLLNELQVIDRKMGIQASKPEWRKYPVIFGEFDPEGSAATSAAKAPANIYREGPVYAAYTLQAYKNSLELADAHGLKLHGALSWSFTFPDQDYFAGFREIATHGIHKPVFNAFEMLGRMKGDRLIVDSTGSMSAPEIIRAGGVRAKSAIDAMASRNGNQIGVLVWNYHDIPVAAPDAQIDLAIEHLPAGAAKATVSHWRIDETHSNAYTAWKKMGAPQPPLPEMIVELKKAGQLQKLNADQTIEIKDGTLPLAFPLPREGVSLIEVRWE